MRKRTKVPRRCDEPAEYVAKNGYWSCYEHAEPGMIKTSQCVGQRCDYPMDGLGAARLENDDA